MAKVKKLEKGKKYPSYGVGKWYKKQAEKRKKKGITCYQQRLVI